MCHIRSFDKVHVLERKDYSNSHVTKFYCRIRLIRSVLRASKFICTVSKRLKL